MSPTNVLQRATCATAITVISASLIAAPPRERARNLDEGLTGLERTADVLEQVVDALGTVPDDWLEPTTDDDFYPRNEAKEALGRLLFYDKILSGNENISCATCHHPLTDTGDGLSLSIGEGARGLGVTRNTGEDADAVHERVPRNAPHVFNLGAIEFERMFHDGRVEPDGAGGFLTPAGSDLLPGLENVLAAQAMFPVTSPTEMAGQFGENKIANAADTESPDLPLVWELLAQRLRANGDYVAMFIEAFDDVTSAADITFAHAANAIAAYEAAAFRADDSPFDRFLRGDDDAMSRAAKRGMRVFYSATGACSQCHTGVFQTDHEFYAVAMPQIGPGKGDNQAGFDDGRDDFGRERVTGDTADRFRFRTPSLRNVALTGPWGHDGAYNTLEAVVRHQLDPIGSLNGYDETQAKLPSRSDLDAQDFVVMNDAARRSAIAAACELPPRRLSDERVADLLAFLHALTDWSSLDLRDEVPAEVPSELPMVE